MQNPMTKNETETYITIPTFFKCPISLDLMKSPVSLCTGVTYDRASIQKWLDGGNNTCPATMQLLPTKDLVPNLTLQRLIKLWSDSVNYPHPPKQTVEEINESLHRLSLEKDDDIRLEILTRLVRYVRFSHSIKEFLSRKKGLVPMLVDIIGGTRFKLTNVFLAISILDGIKGGDREMLSNLMLMNGGDCLTGILLAIRRGNLETKIESFSVLKWISFDARSKVIIAEREGILTEVIKLISIESDPTVVEASLSLLITLSKSMRVRSKLISVKIITKIKNILLSETTNVAITEKSLKLLETLSSTREGRSEISGCLEGVVKKMLKVSTTATEHAVTILWCLCYVFREDKTVGETVERSNGVTKLLVVIQSNCSALVRQMAKDLIKVLKIKSAVSALAAYETKTTHITPF